VRSEQKASERERENARKTQLAYMRNTSAGMQRISRVATRVSLGLAGVASASFISAYKEYKKYTESVKKGKPIKTSLSPDLIKKFGQFDKVFGKSKENVLEFRNAIALQLLPQLTTLLTNLNKLYEANKDIINSQFITWLKMALYGIVALKTATTGMQIAQAFNLINTSMQGVGASTLTTTTAIKGLTRAILPLTIFAAILEDIWVGYKGGDSVTGNLVTKAEEKIKSLTEELNKKYFNDENSWTYQARRKYDHNLKEKEQRKNYQKTGKYIDESIGLEAMGAKTLKEFSKINNISNNNQKITNAVNVTVAGITLNAGSGANRTEIEASIKNMASVVGAEIERTITAKLEAKQQADFAITINGMAH
jgi:hypothetical protein